MTPPTDPVEPEEAPGVPGFASWRGVYLFVFATFVTTVILLTVFSRFFA